MDDVRRWEVGLDEVQRQGALGGINVLTKRERGQTFLDSCRVATHRDGYLLRAMEKIVTRELLYQRVNIPTSLTARNRCLVFKPPLCRILSWKSQLIRSLYVFFCVIKFGVKSSHCLDTDSAELNCSYHLMENSRLNE